MGKYYLGSTVGLGLEAAPTKEGPCENEGLRVLSAFLPVVASHRSSRIGELALFRWQDGPMVAFFPQLLWSGPPDHWKGHCAVIGLERDSAPPLPPPPLSPSPETHRTDNGPVIH